MTRFGGHPLVRPALSAVLAVLATLLLVPAVLANWARSEVYDEHQFTDHATEALERDAVHDALVAAIVDRIVAAAPSEALSVRPLIEFIATVVVDSRAFVDTYRDDVETLHENLFDEGGSREPVTLTFVDAFIVVLGLIEQAYPEVAADLPPGPPPTLVEIPEGEWVVRLLTAGEDVGYLAALFPALVLALYGTSLVVSNNRRDTLVTIGAGAVGVAILLAAGRDFAGNIVLDQVPFDDREVTGAIWDVYLASLAGWALALGGAGLVVALLGSGVARRVSITRDFDRVRSTVTFEPGATWAKGFRAMLFIALGLLAIVEREQVVELAGLAIGAYIVYYGLSELLWIALREAPDRPAREPGLRVAPGWLALRGAAFASLLLIAASSAYVTYRAFETPSGRAQATGAVKTCNGRQELCERRLDEVVFLGTHNSMSASSVRGWYFAENLSSIPQQLESGVRALLIDTWYGYDVGSGVRTEGIDFVGAQLPPEVYGQEVVNAANRLAGFIGTVGPEDPRGTFLCHSYCELGATPLVQTLQDVRHFLVDNPGEVVIILVQDQISPEDTARAFIASELVNHVYHHQAGAPLPTLREMIDTDQRVVVLSENAVSDIDWYLPAYTLLQDTPFTVRSPAGFSCLRARGEPSNPLLVLNHWVSRSIPTTADAALVNDYDFLMERVRECEAARGRKVNLVNVNYSEIGDAAQVVDVLNGAPPPGQEDDE